MTEQIAVLLAELAVKSGLLLGLAFAITAMARRLSSEERHTVWMFALFGLLLLPVASGIGPGVAVPVQAMMAELAASPSDVPAVADASTDDSGRAIPGEPGNVPAPGASFDVREAGPSGAASRWRPVDAASVGAILYAAVAGLLLTWFGLTNLRIQRLLRRYAPITDVSLLALLIETKAQHRIRRDIQLKVSHSDCTPWTWGWLRPVIVLPQDFAQLPTDCQSNAMHHEVSHIARFDFLTTLAGCICCALYWFQPLVWLAFRRMARESELACDDRVLLAGGHSTDYAAQLLDLARTVHTRNTRPILVTAMAGRSPVSLRISSILDPGARRRTMNKVKALCTLTLAFALVLPLAALKSQAAPTGKATELPEADTRTTGQNAPADSDELARIISSYSEQGKTADIRRLFVDYISRDADDPDATPADSACRFCGSILKSEDIGNERSELLPALLAAFDEVESRARTANDGDLLLKLVAISSASGSDQAMQRGTYYLLEGFRIGHLSDSSKLEAIHFLAELGWYRQARKLAEQLHNDESSSLYHSAATDDWMRILDRRIALSDSIYEQLSTPGFTTIVDPEGDMVPLYRRAPVYPPTALAQGLEGEVALEFTITEHGKTDDIKVVSSSNAAFNDTAADALSDFLYAPRLVDGMATEVTEVQMMMRFKLEP